MSKRHWIIATMAVIATLFISTGIYAGTKVEDVIKLNEKAYAKHKKGIVVFSHKKHQKEYEEKHPEFYKNSCGECHHEDKDGKSVPLKNLKEGDNVKKCIECHKKPGYIKGKKAKGLTKKQKREYHANAYHDNCRGCHRTFNKKMKLKSKDKGAAPTTCKRCHPKKK